jgi:uncharacterized protein (TIRG00374 family)
MPDAVLSQLGRKHLLQGLIGIVLAGALLSLCIYRAEPTELLRSLGSLTVSAIIPALVCEAVVQLSKALKWQAILSRVHTVRYSSTLSAVVIGAASTHLVPLRLDEVLRSAVLARREGIAPGTVLGTVAIDRIIELLVVGLIFGAAVLVLDLPAWMVTAAWILGGALVATTLAVLGLLAGEERVHRWLVGASFRSSDWLARALRSLARGLRGVPRGKALLLVLIGAAGEWIATILFYVWMLRIFAVTASDAVPLIMAIGNSIAYMVPNVPGALGMYEGVQAGILESLAGVAPAPALALALAAHAVLMIPVTAAGLVVAAFEFRRSPAGSDDAPEAD